MYDDLTVIICCAGMGTRLGIGTTKALVKVNGKSIIEHLLNKLTSVRDVRIVVGYQAEKVIEEVNKRRKDVMFAFNNDYKTTGVADSLRKGNIGSNKYVVYIDGDVLIDQDSINKILDYDGECLAVKDTYSDEPVLASLDEDGNVTTFLEGRKYSWPGIAKIECKKLLAPGKNVYDVLSTYLPMKAIYVNAWEIDTQDDYERAVRFYRFE